MTPADDSAPGEVMAMCDAVGNGPLFESVRCVVDWPHTIHCGYAGRMRCRWTDDGAPPSDDELRAWDEKWKARMSDAATTMQAK